MAVVLALLDGSQVDEATLIVSRRRTLVPGFSPGGEATRREGSSRL